VGGDMVGLVALDFVLGIIIRGMVDMSLVVEVFGVDRNNGARYPAGFGVPTHMIADFESLGHLLGSSLLSEDDGSVCGACQQPTLHDIVEDLQQPLVQQDVTHRLSEIAVQ
jgi:hypothetical protein